MVTTRLDEIDRKILAELQADGRMTNVELAKRVGIYRFRRVRRHVVSARRFAAKYVDPGWRYARFPSYIQSTASSRDCHDG